MDPKSTTPRSRDYRDLIIEELVTSEAALQAALADARAELAAYRTIALATLARLHEATVELERRSPWQVAS